MYTKIKPVNKNALTSSEMTILKSFALGLGCDTIQSLLEIDAETYQSYCQQIFQKLDTCNAYTAVHKAFQTGLLHPKEYLSENIKSFALEFSVLKHHRFQSCTEGDKKQSLWELYDLLLEFQSRIETQFRSTLT